jgi:DDE superfamily endonuclease
MHPVIGTGTVKVKQHTQQIKRRIALQQDIEQLLFHRSQGGFASSTHGTLSLWQVLKQTALITLFYHSYERVYRIEVDLFMPNYLCLLLERRDRQFDLWMSTANCLRNYFRLLRSYEAFKLLHLGMISEVKRKSLPAIASSVGLENHQNLHHFLTESPWTVQQLRSKRLELILQVLNGRSLILLIDETGDCKKGKSTDYVKRQYIGNVGKKENRIVAVTAYGLVDGMILPLSFEVYKPRERLQDGDVYQTKPQIAAMMIRQLQAIGFDFELGKRR